MPSYLTAGKIKEGMSGTISGEPREEKHTFNEKEGEKILFRVPITLDKAIKDDYAEEDVKDWTWNPGLFARSFLEAELGEEYQAWINTHGSFHPRAWSTKNKSGFSWHFIPDENPVVEKVVNAGTALYTANELMEKVAVPIECAYCAEAGDFWSTSRPENMLAHIEKFHPEKVKSELNAVKARVKKE